MRYRAGGLQVPPPTGGGSVLLIDRSGSELRVVEVAQVPKQSARGSVSVCGRRVLRGPGDRIVSSLGEMA
jgi:hypothetical protein